MTAQQLKNAILQEAIQGRLVPQDPNDEPASVLLDRIRKEKQHLVKEGKLKKKDLEEKPISEDEIPFEIPESWEWVRFSQLYWQLTDGTHSTPKYKVNGIPFLSVKDMSTGKLDFSNTKFISAEEHSILSQRCHPQKGDLLISKVGTTGIPLIIDTDREFSIFVSLALIKFFPQLIDCNYLLHLINSPLVQLQVKDNTRGVGNKNWVLTAISNTIMVLPPLAEQHRIVAKIEELMPKVEEYGKAQEKLNKLNEELPERLKKSILQEAIEGRLVPLDPNDEPASILLDKIREEKKQLVKEGKLKKKDLEEKPISEDEIPFEIPETWEWGRISEIVNVLMGQSPDGNDVYESKQRDEAYEFHQGKICFTDRYIAPSGKWCKNPSRIAESGSLLVCVRAPIGDVNITDRNIVIGRGLAAIKGYAHISTDFLFYWMNGHKQNLVDKGTGSTFKAITVEVLKNQSIPLPPLAEQHRIVAKIEQLFMEIDKLKTK